MAYADQGLPPWLQRNISPSEPFDPTPWLQERFRREVIKAKLPLELQQMELANKAMNLQVETQGLQNDLVNQEMDIYAQELPALRQYMSQAESTPGGALSLRAPAFRSKKAMAAIAERQKLDAETGYGMALNRTIVEQTKNAAEWMALTGRVIRPGPDGTFNPEEYAALGALAAQAIQTNELAAVQARQRVIGQSQASAPAAVQIAREMTKAEEDLNAATAASDDAAAARANRYLKNLKQAQSLQNRDPNKMAVLSMIKSAIGAIDRQLHGQWSMLMDDTEKAALLRQREELEAQLRGTESEGDSAAPAQSSDGGAKEIGGFKVRIKR